MRHRGEDIHVWPVLTDLMGGITLVIMLMLTLSIVFTRVDRSRTKQLTNEHKELIDVRKKLAAALEDAARNASCVGVKRELLETLKGQLRARHVSVEILPSGHLVIPADFLFATGKSDVDPDSVRPLGSSIAALLKSAKGVNVRYVLVVGHTDDSGPPDVNLDLSLKRALSLVATWNTNQLFGETGSSEALCAMKKLVPSGMGQMSPAVDSAHCGNRPDDPIRGCRANRRIEIQIVPKEADDDDPCKPRHAR